MKLMKWMRLAGMMMMVCVATGLMSGCDDGGDDSGGGNALVGTWEVYKGDTVQGEPTYWWYFNSDGTWYGADSKGGNPHYSGTYTVSGNSFEGPFVNGSVGDGKIEGTFEGENMTIDFIEYWHDPAKHNPLVGKKLP